jgi:hypothetical protein
MMNIDQLLGTGSDALRIPNNVGTAFDAALKVGSFVESGMDKYREAVAEWNELKRFTNRLKNYKNDPQAIYYIVNSLLRNGVVRFPNADNDPVLEDSAGMIRSAWKKMTKMAGLRKGKAPFTINDYIRFATGSNVSDGINTPSSIGINPDYARNIPDAEIGGKKRVTSDGTLVPVTDSFVNNNEAEFKTLSTTDEFTSDHLNNETVVNSDRGSAVKLPPNKATNKNSYRVLADGESTNTDTGDKVGAVIRPNNQDIKGKPNEQFSIQSNNVYPSGDQQGRRVDVNYRNLNYPYLGNIKTVDSPSEVIHFLEAHNLSFSYKYWTGYELGTDNIWAIKLRRFKGKHLVPKLPRIAYVYSYAENKNEDSLSVRALGEYCPCISYSLNIGNSGAKQIPLINGASFSIPMPFQYNMTIGLDLVDDVYKSWYNFMCNYMNAIYDVKSNSILPFTESAIEIELSIFRPGFLMNYRLRMYAIPTNFNNSLMGEAEAQVNTVHIDFSIIGIHYPVNKNSAFFSNENDANGSANKNALKWNDIYPHPS